MKLKEYLATLNKIVAERPEALDFDLVFSIDDEGNAYKKVYFDPTLGNYDGDDWSDSGDANSICIN